MRLTGAWAIERVWPIFGAQVAFPSWQEIGDYALSGPNLMTYIARKVPWITAQSS